MIGIPSKRALARAMLAVLAAGSVAYGLSAGSPKTEALYRVVFQVTSAQPEAWDGALRNIENLTDALGAERTRVEVVVNSGGIGMARKDNAALAGRIERLALGGSVTFLACENTMKRKGMQKQDLHPSFGTIDSGVAQVVRRQAEGWQFLKSGP